MIQDDANQFGQITEFSDDVYIYGTLYTDIEASDIDFTDVDFDNATINENLFVSGLSISHWHIISLL